MANQRITALTAMSGRPDPDSVMCGVDTTDTTMSASGTTKKFTCGVESGGLGLTIGTTDLALGSNQGNTAAIMNLLGLTSVIADSFTGGFVGDITGDVKAADGNVAFDSGATVALSSLGDGVTATTQSASDNSTKVATTAYVDTQAGASDTLAEVLAIGNTTGSTNIIVSASQSITVFS